MFWRFRKANRHHVVKAEHVLGLPNEKGVVNSGKWNRYAMNEKVMAMYPNTTSFYVATVLLPNPEVL